MGFVKMETLPEMCREIAGTPLLPTFCVIRL